MEKYLKYGTLITFLLGGVGTGITYISDKLLEGAEAKGYMNAKKEMTDEQNKAIIDAITIRAEYDVCCSGAAATTVTDTL